MPIDTVAWAAQGCRPLRPEANADVHTTALTPAELLCTVRGRPPPTPNPSWGAATVAQLWSIPVLWEELAGRSTSQATLAS